MGNTSITLGRQQRGDADAEAANTLLLDGRI
jgi:hypothetical protein